LPANATSRATELSKRLVRQGHRTRHGLLRPMCPKLSTGHDGTMSSRPVKRNGELSPTASVARNIHITYIAALRRRGAHPLAGIQRTQHNLAPALEGPASRPQARRLVPMQQRPAS